MNGKGRGISANEWLGAAGRVIAGVLATGTPSTGLLTTRPHTPLGLGTQFPKVKLAPVTRDAEWLSTNLRQFIRFGVVGGTGVLVNLGVGVVMHRLNGGTINAGEPLLTFPGTELAFRYRNLVWVSSFLVANLFNYQLNRLWTFRGHGVGWWRGFWPFLAVGSVAMVAGLAIQWALTHPGTPIYLSSDWFTEDIGLRSREYWAQVIAILITMPINFVVNKVWTFGRGSQPSPGVAPTGAGKV